MTIQDLQTIHPGVLIIAAVLSAALLYALIKSTFILCVELIEFVTVLARGYPPEHMFEDEEEYDEDLYDIEDIETTFKGTYLNHIGFPHTDTRDLNWDTFRGQLNTIKNSD